MSVTNRAAVRHERQEDTMKIAVVPGRCQGHALCAGEAPDVFRLDDDGFNVTPPTDVDPADEAAVRRAVANCPERALRVES
jgi:ferredoxin